MYHTTCTSVFTPVVFFCIFKLEAFLSSVPQRSGAPAQRLLLRALPGGGAARDPRRRGERGRPVEVHAAARGRRQGQVRDLQTTAPGERADELIIFPHYI